jgi:hypothetical protein
MRTNSNSNPLRIGCWALLWIGLVGWKSVVSAGPPDPAQLAAKIDTHLAKGWKAAGVTPAPVIDDAGFIRRAYLDMVGRIPTAAEVRAFLADQSPDKRSTLVRQLIGTGAYSRHMAGFWRRTWVPQSETGEYSRLAEEMENWLSARLRAKATYDQLVTELLLPVDSNDQRASWRFFYAAANYLPENLAASTTRSFLGVNLDCAQCHDHPFASWTREQFWQTAAFFAKPSETPDAPPLEIIVAETETKVTPLFLSNEAPTWPEQFTKVTGPEKLAAWITARENPYFTKNAVNRLWAEFFGAGMIEPLDDLSGQVPASHPELLGELAQAFADSNYNLEYLTTALALTKLYQLESTIAGNPAADNPQLFARMPVRGLSGVQLYDSLRIAAGYPPEQADVDATAAARDRRTFAGRFRTERPTDAERSVTQALTLINGKFATELTDPNQAPTLIAVANAPFLNVPQKVETLFFAALGRPPSEDERALLVKHVESGGSHGATDKALGDIFWALLNSSEFNTNH